ncbi:hypothetical protein HOK31_18215 [Candidatus Poribacteria bacterium]|jgi:hypothetical protein|nr:hypothetical protein [Candidatus Poribacteria bacterium]
MSDNGEHPNVRRAFERQRKWMHETDMYPKTPERKRELDEMSKAAAERHERSGRKNIRG